MPLKALLDCFLVHQRLRNNSAKTIHNYSMFIGLFFAYLADKHGITAADTLTIHHVNAYHLYLQEKPSMRGKESEKRVLSGKSIQTYMRHVKIFLRFCFNEELITTDIARKMVTPKAEKPVIEILTDKEAAELLNSFNTRSLLGMRNYCICLLMLDCGLRVSEVCGLRVGDVNLDVGYAAVTGKGKKGRVVPVGVKCRQMLLRYIYRFRFRSVSGVGVNGSLISAVGASISQNEYIFITQSGSPLSQTAVVQVFRRLKKRLNISRLHAHLLRHTFATNFLLANLGDVYQLAQLLGHDDIKTTQIYLHAANFYKIIQKGGSSTYADITPL